MLGTCHPAHTKQSNVSNSTDPLLCITSNTDNHNHNQTTTTKNNIQNDEHLPQQEPVQVSKVDQVESTPSAASEHSSRQDDFVHWSATDLLGVVADGSTCMEASLGYTDPVKEITNYTQKITRVVILFLLCYPNRCTSTPVHPTCLAHLPSFQCPHGTPRNSSVCAEIASRPSRLHVRSATVWEHRILCNSSYILSGPILPSLCVLPQCETAGFTPI